MKDWVPFLQSLVWPIFVAALLLIFRRSVRQFLETIQRKIEAGAQVGVGLFTLGGTAPVLKSDETAKVSSIGLDRGYLSEAIYVVHAARFARIIEEGKKDYEISVWVFSRSQEIQDRIERVEYRLHSTYKRRIRDSKDKEKNFELVLLAWGQFNLKVQVYLSGESQPVVLWRFLNF